MMCYYESVTSIKLRMFALDLSYPEDLILFQIHFYVDGRLLNSIIDFFIGFDLRTLSFVHL